VCGDSGMNKRKLLAKLLAGSKNIRFDDFVSLLEALGFRLSRINGSHRIFSCIHRSRIASTCRKCVGKSSLTRFVR